MTDLPAVRPHRRSASSRRTCSSSRRCTPAGRTSSSGSGPGACSRWSTGPADRRALERLCAALPDIVPVQPPVLNHGDPWSGNIMADADGGPVLIDPAASYTWAESDLSIAYRAPRPPAVRTMVTSRSRRRRVHGAVTLGVPGGVVRDGTPSWDPDGPGVFRLPSGRLIRGRALRRPLPSAQLPDFAVHLLGAPPAPVDWESRWVRWSDFWLPRDQAYARKVLHEAWEYAADRRVEVGCGGGRGRTGTALACIAVLDGVPASRAVAYVREHYDRRAVETPWQRRFVSAFAQDRHQPQAR